MTHEQEYINEVSLENLISNHNNLQGNNTNTATYGDNLVVSHNINSAEAWANQNPFKKPLRIFLRKERATVSLREFLALR